MGGYGLGLTQEYSVSLFGGYIWYYEGETLAARVVFAYWPQYNLVLTMAANSNVSDAIDPVFPETVLSSALTALLNAGTIQASGSATTN